MNRVATRALILLNLLAMAGLAYLWVDQQGKLRNMIWLAPAPVYPVIAPPSLPDKSTNPDASVYLATIERPLFAPDRRPPPPPPPVLPPPPPDPLADAQLLGLVGGEAGGVLIRAEGKVRRVKLSQKLGDWTLQGVVDRNATFARGNETRVIRLAYARLGAPAPVVNKPANAMNFGTANTPPNLIEMARRQAQEEEAKNRAVDEMRARMSKKSP